MKQTKIVCTIGPASESVKTLTAMVKAGMNVARLNFSHGTYANHKLLMKNIRQVSKTLNTPIAIIQDLQGPKIRVAELKKPVDVKAGQSVTIGEHLELDYDVSKFIKPGHRILIEDGTIELKVIKVQGKKVVCEVITAGKIQSHKGINLPDSNLTIPFLTKKDIEDLQFGLKQDVDFVAVSFVRSKKDIVQIKHLIQKYNPSGFEVPQVIAKIERPEAVKNFDDILKEVDVVMVARGDLGVEVADSQVPIIQKTLIRKCLEAAKPVIVATQMLDSMIRNPKPTRAEVSDVANAVIDRADAVMLSGESAFGKYPVAAVTEMGKIIEATEASPYAGAACIFAGDKNLSKVSAIAESACNLVANIQAKVIISLTQSGVNARFLSHQRPGVPIVVMANRPKRLRQLCMLWGINPVFVRSLEPLPKLVEQFIRDAKASKFLKKNDKILVVAGNPIDQKMNVVEVKTVT
jgi:pyruvate kinase